jgi:electron transfer flavoprotein alpha subunit
MSKEIWVYVERVSEGATETSLQGIALARGLAERLQSQVGCLLFGSNLEAAAQDLLERGVKRVYLADDSSFESYRSRPFAKQLIHLCEMHRPELLLLPASTQGNDLASAVSSAIGTGSVLDCDLLEEEEEGRLVGRRAEFDRLVLTGFFIPEKRPQVFTIKEGICEEAQHSKDDGGEIIKAELSLSDEDMAVRVIESKIARRSVNLKEAKTIVAAGAGVGSKENFRFVEELAGVLGAEIGATRAAVDAGWVSHDRQIGQTGVNVGPDLYIACGISGAIQHRVGMIESEKIVAINVDPNAPIFRFCHYGIVGDMREVIPRLIQTVKG